MKMEAHLILLGVLCFCGWSLSQECKPQLQKNWEFPGFDVATVFSPDAEHCQYMCTDHPSCQFFTFVAPDSTADNRYFSCFLKVSASGQPGSQGPKQGVISGFSLKPCNPDPKPCLPQIYQNTDFNGADYKSLFTADYMECQRVCTEEPACQFFTLANDVYVIESSRYRCNLKFSWTVPVIPQIVAATGFSSGFSQRLETSPNVKTECEAKLFPNINFQGNDILTVLAASAEHCQTLCSTHPLCTYFSYSSNDFKCYLKKNALQMIPTATTGVTSGLPSRFCKPSNNWVKKIYQGVNFPTNDIRNFTMDYAEGCQSSCTADPYCQYFTYTPDKRCFLKRVNTVPAPSLLLKEPNGISGFSLKNCQNR